MKAVDVSPDFSLAPDKFLKVIKNITIYTSEYSSPLTVNINRDLQKKKELILVTSKRFYI